MRAVPGVLTQVTFCELCPPDDFPLYFSGRTPLAPDLMLRPQDVDPDAVRSAGVFWLTATGVSTEPSRAAHHAALHARSQSRHTVLDLDYRPSFWPDAATARAEVEPLLSQAVR